MTEVERLRKFYDDFARLQQNREKVPLEQLRTRYVKAYNALVAEVQAGADWYAATYINLLVGHFPIHPQDAAGKDWLWKKLNAILEEERRPGGRFELYRAALMERLDRPAFEQLVWEIYNRLEVEAFDPYWQRHNKWVGEPGKRWIYNDITRKFWLGPERRGEGKPGFWINSDYTGEDSRFPPHIKEE